MNIIKTFMAKLIARRVVPTPAEAEQGAQPMNQSEIVAFLQEYKKQNPSKYEAKKASLLKRYNLLPEAVPEPVRDASDLELEEIAKTVKKNGNK